MKKALYLILVIFGLGFAARAQDEVPPPMPVAPTFTDAQVDQLVGPIALYPDPLVAVLLPAATLPTQIVMADRYISNGGDPGQMDPQTFDQSVIALAHYPDVLKWMDDNLNWTTQLGQAFQNQQQDVMNSVQRLRMTAYNLGNLQSTPQQQVINDNGYIEILPANPNNLYVPDYMPTQVFYQQPYGAPFVTFSVGFVIGPWLCRDPDWWHHRVVCWDQAHPRPHNWWFQKPAQRQVFLAGGHANVWNANNRGGVVPGFQGGDRGWNNQQNGGWNNQVNHNAPGVNVPAGATHGVPPGSTHGTPPGANHAVPPGSMHPMNQGTPANHSENIPNNPRWDAPAPSQPAPQPTERFGQNDRDDAFISSQNAQDARTFSNRGAESTGTQSHPSGGGFHNGVGGGGGAGGFHGSTSGGAGSGGSNGGSHSGGGGGGNTSGGNSGGGGGGGGGSRGH